MNAQQMVEHMCDSVLLANGKIKKNLITPSDLLERYRTFMLSDKPFKENTKNIELPDTPAACRNNSIELAIDELKRELDTFFILFANQKDLVIMNPIFGNLNYEQWLHLLHKHAMHHLRQFQLV
ncbi:MAG: hypothetical protein J0M08_11295 [Bacteroidetes bacterium]|nr:hypothetical protein [Bacteroidota bacterium]